MHYIILIDKNIFFHFQRSRAKKDPNTVSGTESSYWIEKQEDPPWVEKRYIDNNIGMPSMFKFDMFVF
jgi:hypothetical protein